MHTREKLLRISTFLVLVSSLAACSSAKVADEDSPQALKKQILELQKAQTANSAKIDELNNKILVLKDQVGGTVAPSAQVAPVVPPAVKNDSSVAPGDVAPTADIPPPPVEPTVTTRVNPMVAVAAPPKEEKTKNSLTVVEKLYRQVVIDSKKQNLVSANKNVGLMLKSYKDSPLTNNALYIYAETLYEHGNYAKSAEEFEKLYKLFPDGNKAVAALYKLALSYQKLGHPTEAQEAFENIVTVYPGSREALDAEKQIMNGTPKDRSGS